jgi:SRSO17 transposase
MSFTLKTVRHPGDADDILAFTSPTGTAIPSARSSLIRETAWESFERPLTSSRFSVPDAWIKDGGRRREARIPDDLEFRTKLGIALALLKRSMSDGVHLEWVTADEFCGRSKDFRNGIAALGPRFAVEIPYSLMGRTKRLARKGKEARRVDELWLRGGPSWEHFHVKDTEKGPEVWDCRISRFLPQENGVNGEECWLIVAQNALSGEVKYFLSNAPEDIKPEVIMKVVFSRWHIERIFEDAKGEVGMGHFEVHNYLSLKRHMIITMLSFLFLARSTGKLREKKFSFRFVK